MKYKIHKSTAWSEMTFYSSDGYYNLVFGVNLKTGGYVAHRRLADIEKKEYIFFI